LTKANGRCLKKAKKYEASRQKQREFEKQEMEKERAIRETITNYDELKKGIKFTLR